MVGFSGRMFLQRRLPGSPTTSFCMLNVSDLEVPRQVEVIAKSSVSLVSFGIARMASVLETAIHSGFHRESCTLRVPPRRLRKLAASRGRRT